MKLEKQKVTTLKIGLSVFLIGLLIGVLVAYAATPSTTFTISSGIYPGAPSYTVWREGNNYFAKDANGFIVYSGTVASTVIQNSLNALTVGRTYKQRVLLKGLFPLSTPISLDCYTILEIDGTLSVSTNIDAVDIIGIELPESVRKRNIEIIGGRILGCNTTSSAGINVQHADFILIDHVDVEGFYIGINFTYGYTCNSILRCKIQANVLNGIQLIHTNALTIAFCQIEDTISPSDAALLIQNNSAFNNVFANVIEWNAGIGVWILNSGGNTIQGNCFEMCGSPAYFESYDTGLESWMGRNRIINNHFDSNDNLIIQRRMQVYLYKSINDIISGNSFIDNMNYTYSKGAIYLASGAQNTIVTDNIYNACGGTMASVINDGMNTSGDDVWVCPSEIYFPIFLRTDNSALIYYDSPYIVIRVKTQYMGVDTTDHYGSWLSLGASYGYGTYEWQAKASGMAEYNTIYLGLFEKHHGWAAEGSILLAWDGIAETWGFYTYTSGGVVESTIITGVDFTVEHTFKVVWTATSVKLYIDDILKATHTTALPPVDMQLFAEALTYTSTPASEPFCYFRAGSFKQLP